MICLHSCNSRLKNKKNRVLRDAAENYFLGVCEQTSDDVSGEPFACHCA